MAQLRIWVDVGGTNTDAVLMREAVVLGSVKWPTSPDVSTCIAGALGQLRLAYPFDPSNIGLDAIRTTHFVNAVVERTDLTATAAIRLGSPATTSLPPFTGWPGDSVKAIQGRWHIVSGGREFDGRATAPLDLDELKSAIEDVASRGIRSVALTSVFSLVSSEMEEAAADVVREVLGARTHISMSHHIGRLGLLERENVTIVNAALRPLAATVVPGLQDAVRRQGTTAPEFVSQNDGTLMELRRATEFPILTFASGPTT